jgi:hypothetical protein
VVGGTAPLLSRAAALVALSVALGAYYVWADSLPISGLWTQVLFLWFLVIPAVFALVYLALPLWQKPWLLQAGIGVAVLAVVLSVVGFDVLANFAKLGAVTLLAWWFLSFFETSAWVATVAVIIPWVDALSVWRGPTKQIVTHKRELFTTFSFAFPVPGEVDTAQLGLPDLLFFALFLGAAARWGLRVKLTWLAMTLSFGATLALTVAFDIGGLPALPLLSLGFLAPNADILWRRLRSPDAWGSLRSKSEAAGP